MHLKISQEPLCMDIYRKNAAPQDQGPQWTTECANAPEHVTRASFSPGTRAPGQIPGQPGNRAPHTSQPVSTHHNTTLMEVGTEMWNAPCRCMEKWDPWTVEFWGTPGICRTLSQSSMAMGNRSMKFYKWACAWEHPWTSVINVSLKDHKFYGNLCSYFSFPGWIPRGSQSVCPASWGAAVSFFARFLLVGTCRCFCCHPIQVFILWRACTLTRSATHCQYSMPKIQFRDVWPVSLWQISLTIHLSVIIYQSFIWICPTSRIFTIDWSRFVPFHHRSTGCGHAVGPSLRAFQLWIRSSLSCAGPVGIKAMRKTIKAIVKQRFPQWGYSK